MKNNIKTINSELKSIESKCFRLETKQYNPKINKIKLSLLALGWLS